MPRSFTVVAALLLLGTSQCAVAAGVDRTRAMPAAPKAKGGERHPGHPSIEVLRPSQRAARKRLRPLPAIPPLDEMSPALTAV